MRYVVVQEIDGVKRLIYFVRNVFEWAELRYQKIEILVLVVVMTTRKLRPCFHVHRIINKINYLVYKVLKKPDILRGMVAWLVKLFKYDIQFLPHKRNNTSVIANFLVKINPLVDNDTPWILLIYVSSNMNGSGVGIVLEGLWEILIKK